MSAPSDSTNAPVADAGTFKIGGDLEVHRLGFGAMRLTGEGIWGEPTDRDEAVRVVQRAVDLGVDLIDTADAYGPEVSEQIIADALRGSSRRPRLATKAGLTRQGPGEWTPVGRPAYLRQQLELSRRRLGVDTIDLWQLHRIDPDTPEDEQFRVLVEAQEAGLVRHVGLSEVGVAEIERAIDYGVQVATVQNHYNLVHREHEAVVDYCEEHGIGFIPWFPIAGGELVADGSAIARIAEEHGASPAQLSVAWLLHRSPVILPIPGTSKVAHLEQNCAAASIELSADEFAALEQAGRAASDS